jgi:hypothetical protein
MSSKTKQSLVVKSLKTSQEYLSTLRNPMNSMQKQRLLSYYNSKFFRKGKPTLNRLQNMLLHQR